MKNVNKKYFVKILAGYAPVLTALLIFVGLSSCDDGAATIGAPSASNGSDDMDDIDSDTNTGPQTIEEIIKACGISQELMDNPDEVIFEKKTKGWPKKFSGSKASFLGQINYEVAVTTVIDIKSTMGGTTTATSFDIVGSPSMAETEAEEQVTPFRGFTRAYGLTTDERLEMADEADEWSGIFCTLQPTQKIRSNVGGESKVIEYSPAITTSVSPLADAERYDAEIGSGKTFSDIKATIQSSSDSRLPVGKTYKGSVTVSSVDPVLKIQATGYQPVEIPSDRAYKVVTDFGSIERTSALGLQPTQTFYINNSKREFEAIVIDSGNETSGIVVLSPHFSQ